MKLSELLAHVGGVMLDDRTDMLSGSPDQLFSDETIVRYLNEAQRILCRRAWVLTDDETPAVCEIALETGVTEYALHKSVLFVKSARLADSDVDLSRVGYDDNRLRAVDISSPDYWDVNSSLTETTGRPSVFSTDSGVRKIRFGRPPSSTENGLKVNLVVVRMPIVALDVNDQEAEPEVSEEHHMSLATYAGGKCLQNPNIDVELRSQGREWVKEFFAAVRDARRDNLALQQSMPQFRFGGWGNGSS